MASGEKEVDERDIGIHPLSRSLMKKVSLLAPIGGSHICCRRQYEALMNPSSKFFFLKRTMQGRAIWNFGNEIS